MARVVLAMSGGVDSSVAAWLLRQQGHEVIGVFMRTGVHVEDACDADRSHKKGCCSSLDAADARQVADQLDLPFYALDFERDFGRIIDYFVDEYSQGRTPNPCVACNNWLKFGKLWSYGKQLDADFVATGHYARVLRAGDEWQLHQAIDPAKDQSYVLFGLRRSLLQKVLFPVGDLPKSRIRELARAAGLKVHAKPDSQEICFVPDGDYAALVRRHRPELATRGPIVDRAGNVLGEHRGIEHFTIGQRKGLRYAAGARRYVLEVLPGENTVVVGTRDECLATGLTADGVNWLVDAAPGATVDCLVKIRYRSRPVAARVAVEEASRARVTFAEPQLAVTPGQAAVFYDGTRVLGGGWIAADTAARSPVPRVSP